MKKFGQKEDHRFSGTLRSPQNHEIHDVSCKIFLPNDPSLQIRIECDLNEQQFRQASSFSRFSLSGKLPGRSEERADEIFSNVVYVDSLSQHHRRAELPDWTLKAYAYELTITRYFKEDSEPPKALFWITANALLEPLKTFWPNPNGTMRVRTLRERRFRHPQWEIKFDLVTHYKGDDYQAKISRHLVANVRPRNGSGFEKFPELVQLIDDVVLLASFAGRHPSVSFRWDLSEKGKMISHYRQRTLKAKKPLGRFLPDVVIDYKRFVLFLKMALLRLDRAGELANYLRTSMYTLVKEPHVIEHDYIALFSALETLVLFFRRKQGLGLILQEDKWKLVRRRIHDALQSADIDKRSKQLLIRNLSALNRISLNDTLVRMCERYKIDIEDLWPFSGQEGSLINLRNQLAHGEPMAQVHAAAIMTATRHLQWLMERVLLRILDWPIEESGVDKHYLRQWIPYHDWNRRFLELKET